MPERENKRKNALPSIPKRVWLKANSCMIGTLDKPITALSATLINMNRNTKTTTI